MPGYPGITSYYLLYTLYPEKWVVEGAGFEPAKPFRTPDLQSGGFNHSPTPPMLSSVPRPSEYWNCLELRRKNVFAFCRKGPGVTLTLRMEPQSGFEPLTCRLQVDCASIAPQGPVRHRSPCATGARAPQALGALNSEGAGRRTHYKWPQIWGHFAKTKLRTHNYTKRLVQSQSTGGWFSHTLRCQC